MTVQDGNKVDAAAVSITPELLVQSVQAGIMGYMQANNSQAPAASEFDRVFNSVAEQEGTDPGSWGSVKNLVEAGLKDLRKDMVNESDAKVKKALEDYRDQSTYQIIRMAVDSHIGDDETLSREKDFIRDRVVYRFNSEEQFKADRVRYQNHDVPIETLKKIAIEEINRLSGKREKTGSPTGMKEGDGLKGVGKNMNDGDDSGSGNENFQTVDVSTLTQQEKDLYHARLGTAQRLGHLAKSKEALAIASKAVLSLRQGKTKAKEKGLGR